MLFNLLEVECFYEKVDDEICINSILTRVNVCTHKVPSRKGMHADMALRDDEECAPSAGVLDVIVGRRHDMCLAQWAHSENLAKLFQAGAYEFLVVQALRIALVPIKC